MKKKTVTRISQDWLEKHKGDNLKKAVDYAVHFWTQRKNGIYKPSEKVRHTPEYCQSQIEYFKKMLTKK